MNKPGPGRPPGPRGRRVVGNAVDYEADRVGFLRRCQAEYGDIFSFSPATVFVGDPVLVHQILDKTNNEYVAASAVFGSLPAGGRLDRDIEGWMRNRGLGSAAMSRQVTKAHGQRLIQAFDATLEQTAGREFDVREVMLGHGGRTVTDFLFGPGAADLVTATERRSELVGKFLTSNMTIPRWLPLPGVRRVKRANATMIDTIAARIDERLAHPHEHPQDMLDLLLADPGAVTGTVRHQVIAMLMVNTIASVGSPGIALSWIVRELARDPQARRRLHDEAGRALSGTGSLVNDRQLVHSKAFVREILRLYPPAWLMGRLVRRDCTLGGYRLRAGQEVMFSPYLMQRDPRWWPEPERFRAERWLAGIAPESRRAYIPFGSGPRMCMGLHLGIYQLVTATSHLAAHYRIESNAADIEPFHTAMVIPRGLRARITRIDAGNAPARAGVLVEAPP